MAPFFVTGVASGLFTAWVEYNFIGAQGEDFHLSIIERVLIAGRAIWFYLGKLVWPDNLNFIYPRWHIDSSIWWQYLFPLAALGLLAALWVRRNRSRGPLAAFLLFCGILFPALGFVNIYPFRYSFVADHFQYLACIAPLTIGAAGITIIFQEIKQAKVHILRTFGVAVLIGALGILSFQQSGMYENAIKLWEMTIKRNPKCSMAYDNLGQHWIINGRFDDGILCFEQALKIESNSHEAHNNLGIALYRKGNTAKAVEHIHAALKINPHYAAAYNNLGMIAQEKGELDEAIKNYQKAIALRKNLPETEYNLGMALLQKARPAEAASYFLSVLASRPDDAEAECKLGLAARG